MPIHTDYVTDITHPEDVPYLKSKLFDVNMRLFRSSDRYRALIIAACDHISWCCLTKADGYKLPHGFSGANAGIPWNIIGIARDRGTATAWCQIMINPVIIYPSREKIESLSNCGSIRLPEPITVRRHKWVKVAWFDREGLEREDTFVRENGGLTIQHEIDHNMGVTILDRAAPSTT